MANIESDKAWMARRSAVAKATEIVHLAQEPYPCGCKRGECTGHITYDGVYVGVLWYSADTHYVPTSQVMSFFDDFANQD